jgi:translation initiation factor 5A
MVPIVNKTELEAVSVEGDNTCTMLKADGTLKEDLKLPADDEELSAEIKKALDEGKEVHVTIIAACGQEKIVSMRTK